MPPVEIKPDIYWIGVNDRTTDLFEGLWPIEQEGVSYNAYLINDEKKAIVDLAKAFKTDEFFDHIAEIVTSLRLTTWLSTTWSLITPACCALSGE